MYCQLCFAKKKLMLKMEKSYNVIIGSIAWLVMSRTTGLIFALIMAVRAFACPQMSCPVLLVWSGRRNHCGTFAYGRSTFPSPAGDTACRTCRRLQSMRILHYNRPCRNPRRRRTLAQGAALGRDRVLCCLVCDIHGNGAWTRRGDSQGVRTWLSRRHRIRHARHVASRAVASELSRRVAIQSHGPPLFACKSCWRHHGPTV